MHNQTSSQQPRKGQILTHPWGKMGNFIISTMQIKPAFDSSQSLGCRVSQMQNFTRKIYWIMSDDIVLVLQTENMNA